MYELSIIAGGEVVKCGMMKAESPSDIIGEGRRLRFALALAGARDFGIEISDFDNDAVYNFIQVVKAHPTAQQSS